MPRGISPHGGDAGAHRGLSQSVSFMRRVSGNDLEDTSEVDTIRNVCCIGAGYVGGPSSAVLALHCPHVTVNVVDLSVPRIAAWNSSSLPIYEPGLKEAVEAVRGRNLFFSNDIQAAIEAADVIYIAVNTPTKQHGRGAGAAADLTYVESAAKLIALYARSHKIVVEKSTVPLGTAQFLTTLLDAISDPEASFDIVSNPEFLAEGTAINDLKSPDRVLIGHASSPSGIRAAASLIEMYKTWIPESKILSINTWSSELAKLAANALLAQRISSMNSLSAICELTGANIHEVSKAVGLDARIGSKFLNASLGFGGSCFKKDVLNLVYIAESLHLTQVAQYWKAVVDMNDFQKERFATRVVSSLFTTLSDKKVTLFGFAYKANTGDTRESAAIDICRYFIQERARVTICDPQVSQASIVMELGHIGCTEQEIATVTFESDMYEASREASAIVICTEWRCFRDDVCDYERIYENMLRPSVVFDGRMVVDAQKLEKIGYLVEAIGRSSKNR